MADTVRLTNEQQEAIQEIERNLQIIACAGSGKTEVITRRIAHILKTKSDVKAKNMVAFTFTEKAAASMKARIAKTMADDENFDINDMYIGTIHGFCYHLLHKYTEEFRDIKILDTVKNHLFVTRYHKECGMSDLKLDLYPRNVNIFLQCIDKMIDDYEHRDAWTQEQRDVLNKYLDCLYSHGYIDFSLLIFETLKQIRNNPNVEEKLKSIRYLVVDEYQDVDDLQEKLIMDIAKQGANICVVGDDDQTIYQFRGSNADNMITFSQRYEDVHQVRLEKNFRCVPGVVDIADCVIKNNEKRIVKKMVSAVAEERTEIEAKRYPSQEDELEAIAEKISLLHKEGISYGEMAVLVRKGKLTAPISSVLMKAGIPVESDSAEHFFAGNYFSRFVETIRILTDVDKAALYECWKDMAEGSVFQAGFKFLRSCARGGNRKLSDILSGFCEKILFLDETAEDIEKRQNDFNGMITILNDYDEIYGDWQLSARITNVLKFLSTQAAMEYKYHSFETKDPNADAVQIMTVHKAKGLEFHTVFLPQLMKREFPVSNMGGKKYWHILGGVFEEHKDKYQSDLEDERKLFYVAVTRAKKNLYMTYELSSQPVSVFVSESAESQYLKIDRTDLTYIPKTDMSDFPQGYTFHKKSNPEWEEERRQKEQEREEERRQKEEYWALVKYAKKQLYDYYGTACHFCPAARGDLMRIKSMTPDEILSVAKQNGLI